MQRRAFMNFTASAATALAFHPLARAAEEAQKTPVLYPDPAVEVIDPRFAKYKIINAAVERLYTGTRWAEGPVWFGDGRYLLFSDIPNNRMLRWLEDTGEVSVFRSPSNYSNGNYRDRQGRLLTCEHDSRRVTRTEHDGTITVLMDSYQGKKLNAPNDLTVHSDRAIWFSDPGYGIMSNYEGHKAPFEVPANVYRLDPKTREVTVVATDMDKPNGIVFRPTKNCSTSWTPAHLNIPRTHTRSGVRRCGWRAPQERPHVRGYVSGQFRRYSLRCGRQPLVGRGMGGRKLQRRTRLCSRRNAHRQNSSAGVVRQHLLRRREEKPPVHGVEPVSLCSVRGDRGRAVALKAQSRMRGEQAWISVLIFERFAK